MKKIFSNCADCGENSSILTQVSAGPEVVFLCSECYNFKYLNEVQNKTKYVEKKNKKKDSYYGLGKFNYLIFKFLCSRFRL